MSFWEKKQDEANAQRPKEELERMAKDRTQTKDQRDSAQRVLKEKK